MPATPHHFFSHRHGRYAFTLIEMTVAIAILLVIILSVGVIFKAAGRAVGVSQSSMQMLSDNRAIQQQLSSDIAGIDKDGFLVIRSVAYPDPANPSGPPLHFDLVSFISTGSFPHRTGTSNNTPFTDNNTVVPAAFITWGQLALEKDGGSNGRPTDPTTYLAPTQGYKVPLNQFPTGIEMLPTGLPNESAMALGRNAMLLAPQSTGTPDINPNGDSVAAYQNHNGATSPVCAIDYDSGIPASIVANGSTDSSPADITQSRIDLAATTPAQIVSYIKQTLNGSRAGANARFEADHFCYRHAALHSPYDSPEREPLVNGVFRMHSIALQGVTSFAVDWTDGSPYAASDRDVTTGTNVTQALVGTTRWYGLYGLVGGTMVGLAKNGNFQQDHFLDLANTAVPTNSYGGPVTDNYTAVFSYDTPRSSWPVALRFRYHIADPANRLQNGRDFVEVIKLPN